MRYEYKDEIIMNLKDYNAGRRATGGTHAFESKLDELGRVYAQAAKADEYEAKAKAFDKYHATISSHLHLKSEPEFSSPPTEVLSDIIDIYNEYESGEPND